MFIVDGFSVKYAHYGSRVACDVIKFLKTGQIDRLDISGNLNSNNVDPDGFFLDVDE